MTLKLKKDILLYGFSLAVLIFALRWLELRLIIFDYSIEVFTLSIAIIFTGLGIWVALKLAKPKIITLEKEVFVERPNNFQFNESQFFALGISKRELEVLNLLAEGLSNEEIAEKLSLSLPTIKSHLSNLYEKMDVKRRTQAIEKARKLSIIA